MIIVNNILNKKMKYNEKGIHAYCTQSNTCIR